MEVVTTSSQSIAEEITRTNTLDVNEASRRVGVCEDGNCRNEQDETCPEVKKCTFANEKEDAESPEREDDWCYLFIHHTKVKALADLIDTLRKKQKAAVDSGEMQPQEAAFVPDFFIHYTTKYVYDQNERVRKKVVPTVSGLVFLQGSVKRLKAFLKDYFPGYYLVNDCATGTTAVIRDRMMKPLRTVMEKDPTRIKILDKPMEVYAKGRVFVRVLTGEFKGWEGVVVRISSDRKLVLRIDNNLTVGVGKIHKEEFEEIRNSLPVR